MTKPKHLPECFNGRQRSHGLPCICDRLHACEQRVTRSKERVIQEAEFNYRRGLSAARDAVAALANKIEHPWASIGDALAAIDALRGKP